MAQIDLQPVTVRRQPARRLPQLAIGLTLYGTSMAMMTRANLGLSPWDVLHQGIMFRTGWTFGTITFVVEAAVLLDRKSTRLNSSHVSISYAVFCLKE